MKSIAEIPADKLVGIKVKNPSGDIAVVENVVKHYTDQNNKVVVMKHANDSYEFCVHHTMHSYHYAE